MRFIHRVKVTTDAKFSENKIQEWLDGAAEKGWELVSATFFGAGVLWVFRREADGIEGEDRDLPSQNPPSET